MGEITDYKNLLLSGMTSAMPTRVVSRDHRDFPDWGDENLAKGVVTIIGQGENEYDQELGRLAQLGTIRLLIVGQVWVGDQADPHVVEDAEDALMDEIKAFCGNPPAGLGQISLIEYRQSGQLQQPYGWISVDVEVLT